MYIHTYLPSFCVLHVLKISVPYVSYSVSIFIFFLKGGGVDCISTGQM